MELKNYTKWGKGLWKLNLELLKNKDTINQIRSVIENAKANKHLHNTLEWWDRLKLTIKKTLIKIGIANKKENEEINSLNKQIADLENQNKTNTRIYTDVLNKCKNIEKTREEGARLRARFTEINKFSRPTKEFYKYEKQIQAKRTINALIDKTGKEINTKEEIMWEIQEYYQTLYKKETSSNLEAQKYVIY